MFFISWCMKMLWIEGVLWLPALCPETLLVGPHPKCMKVLVVLCFKLLCTRHPLTQRVMDCWSCVFLSRFNNKTTEIWSFYWKCISLLCTQLHMAHGQLLVWRDCSLTGCGWGVVVFELRVMISPSDPSISSSVASHIGYTRFCSMLNSGTLKLVAAQSRMLLTWSVISLEC